jgi:late competence protein required for DNA uptake (superfamily II DNA/RNA helicase)
LITNFINKFLYAGVNNIAISKTLIEVIFMVKINISIEGENVSEIVEELLNLGIGLVKSHKKEIREALKVLADESLNIMMEQNILERGAQLYKKINSEINWTYKREKK